MKVFGSKWTGSVHINGAQYMRQNTSSPVEYTNFRSTEEEKHEVQFRVWDLGMDEIRVDSGYTGRIWS